MSAGKPSLRRAGMAENERCWPSAILAVTCKLRCAIDQATTFHKKQTVPVESSIVDEFFQSNEKRFRRLEVVQPIYNHPLAVDQEHIRHRFHAEGCPQCWVLVEIDEDQLHLVEELRDFRVVEGHLLQLQARRTPIGPEIDDERLIGLMCLIKGIAQKLGRVFWHRRFDGLQLFRARLRFWYCNLLHLVPKIGDDLG